MKTPITGITGMLGSQISRLALSQGYETCGIARFSAASRMAVLQDKDIFRCDILDRGALERVVDNPEPQLMRPSDEPLLLGDNVKLKPLGWSPGYSMKETLTTVYEDWVSRI